MSDDVKCSVYMTEIRKEKWGDRPLSKLTSDIIRNTRKRDALLSCLRVVIK